MSSHSTTASHADFTLLEIDYCNDPAAQVAALRELGEAVWLDSAGSQRGRWQIVSAAPDVVVEQYTSAEPCLFERAGQLLAELTPLALPELPFTGGVIGLFGYAANHHRLRITAPLAASPGGSAALPLARIGRYRWAALSDDRERRSWLLFDASCSGEFIADIQHRLGAEFQPDQFALSGPFAATSSAEQYMAGVTAVKQYISAGDCYQANLAQHFSAPYCGDPLTAYRALRAALPSPHSCYWQWRSGERDAALLSLSPERFLKLTDRRVETKPIKGTVARADDSQTDLDNAAWLAASEKDRAENLMIVDLMRNDIGRSCQPGSIAVDKLFGLESYANVHHLVSTVSGQLRDDCSAAELLASCFPGGSITGAPKRRAMQVIDELEPVGRSYYCGSVIYLSSNGKMDSSIAIRSAIADGEHIHLWGGGGIVADSDPAIEYQESLIKIRLLMTQLAAL
jgi:para-aminobenzoate synthetase component 1